VKKDIPVHVLNSRRPESTGTLIIARPRVNSECVVKSIAYKEGITLISIVSTRMFLAHGFLEHVFDVFHKYETVVHTVATSGGQHLGHNRQRREPRAYSPGVENIFNGERERQESDRLCCRENLKNSPGVAAKVLVQLRILTST